MHRILLIILVLLTVILASSYTTLPVELIYKLGLSGDKSTSCCDESQISQDGEFDETASTAIYDGKVIDYPKTSLAQVLHQNEDAVLGTTTNSLGETKWIEVSLAEQKLRAFEGNKVVMEFLISSGKWFPTPKGDYKIWYKTRLQRMKGGSKALGTYYDLPNVPHNMFFYKGFAVHGAYWHNNFGNPMSHGCVNAPLANVAQLFEWAGPNVPAGQNAIKATAENPGTRVYVH